jgi:acyl carrier protein
MTEHFISKFKELFFESDDLVIFENTRFRELTEWDSLTALSLIAMMDSEFGVKLTGEKLKSINTVKEIYLLIND